ncbi:glycosyltransferase family 2 protein [Leucobacter insecticola]|uniref:Glycosyltransferase family 2 protein n=1 Tax=Leucobacter insecticola TaxID=2714934 RepID=A0A6G8FIK6_9MICO|nr:glycosyltransferase family A protein [Leucobacter insecticola]QIM15882.1 glycosyltransferase family 2 protein [Leucobacter insecticola]
MFNPSVDVTIAVHSASRPIKRAVASVLEHTIAPVRVNVVAHNIDPEIIRVNLGSYADHPQLRLLELWDDIPSPAGPMNYGFANSEAPFISVMGSDDELAPGAIDSWLALQSKTSASTVLARIQLPNGRTDPYPPVRRGSRTRRLDARKDRLAYRSAPLGLIDRRRFGELRLTEGVGSGEDLVYSLTLWYQGSQLAYDLAGPAYIINDDAEDRVTSGPRPIAEDFAFLDELEAQPWFQTAGASSRIAIITKLIRIHFFDAVLSRSTTAALLHANRQELCDLSDRLLSLAPGALPLLSLADRRVLDELLSAQTTPELITAALTARLRYLSAQTLLPKNPLRALHSQAPFRTLFAGYGISRRR